MNGKLDANLLSNFGLDGVGATPLKASDIVVASLSSEFPTNSNVQIDFPGKFVTNQVGTIRLKFDMKQANGLNTSAVIYKNGTSIGTVRTSNSSTYITYAEDFSCSIGDTFSLKVWVANNNYTSYYKNFNLCILTQNVFNVI